MNMFKFDNIDNEYLEKKNWGHRYNILSSPFVAVDVCFIEKGGYSSLHRHTYKYNRFFVVSGKLQLTIEIQRDGSETKVVLLGPEENERKIDVTPGIKHQFFALERTVLIEIESVRLIKDDIIRDTIGGITNNINSY